MPQQKKTIHADSDNPEATKEASPNPPPTNPTVNGGNNSSGHSPKDHDTNDFAPVDINAENVRSS
ncbi:uncharacterized protein ColSpa_08684 [Colletotrichum spaethianum]|uniref:Uncharacterized protein n=1 Tax=Colletotrichum spaethianum TaxID=700344 RepID=A0AA37PA62_9PEZI|nr:uncharacterized protein ColSpa_08684 [Colletotrichum spaethianum]GKT48503.1 hypothetical protein ColSpa_08684 [Colletotrichum spaethianum]GKT94476.1 hypothetical protein Ct61P_12326 [Colletotrichum tofieldiae]